MRVIEKSDKQHQQKDRMLVVDPLILVVQALAVTGKATHSRHSRGLCTWICRRKCQSCDRKCHANPNIRSDKCLKRRKLEECEQAEREREREREKTDRDT